MSLKNLFNVLEIYSNFSKQIVLRKSLLNQFFSEVKQLLT